MNRRIVIAIALLILFSTITTQKKLQFSKFNLTEIQIENNFILKKEEINKLLIPFYNRNLLFLSYAEIEKELMKNSFVRGFNVKKIYPNKLLIKIFEKKPIAILVRKKEKFYLDENINQIRFKELKDYNNLPYVFGNKKEFKIFYNNLKSINFPLEIVKKFSLYDSNRWDLETSNKILIKLPVENYLKSLENFLTLKELSNMKKYNVFDYRIQDQLILK